MKSFILSVLLFLASTFALANIPIDSHCDIPADNVQSLAKPDANSCALDCEANSKCMGFVYASGWGRCFLKAKAPKKVKIQFFSGEKDAGVDAEPKADMDYKGKDLRRVAHIKDARACAKECASEAKCLSYTYIAGYGDCWLKSTKARFQGKVFSCGIR